MELKNITYSVTGEHDNLGVRTAAEAFLANQRDQNDANAYGQAALSGFLHESDDRYQQVFDSLHTEALQRLTAMNKVQYPADIVGANYGQ